MCPKWAVRRWNGNWGEWGFDGSDPVLRAARGVAVPWRHAWCSPTAPRRANSPAASTPNTAFPRARAWLHLASPCRRAVAPTASASPIRSRAGSMFPRRTSIIARTGLASWYGDDFHGRLTANGEVFDMDSLTAAHPTLPMPCYARVTNLSNGKSLIVRVNDRGPYHGNRLIDVSNKAADFLNSRAMASARVRVEYVGRAPLEGSDDRQLMATLRTGVPAPSPSLVRVASARPFVPEVPPRGRPIRGEVPMPRGPAL